MPIAQIMAHVVEVRKNGVATKYSSLKAGEETRTVARSDIQQLKQVMFKHGGTIYTIIDSLKSGSCGFVCTATRKKEGTTENIVVKVAAMTQRIETEIRLYRHFGHEGTGHYICECLGAFAAVVDCGRQYGLLALARYDTTLWEASNGVSLSTQKCVRVILQMVKALQFLHTRFTTKAGHSAYYCHLHINADNILLDTDGTARLCGFSNATMFYEHVPPSGDYDERCRLSGVIDRRIPPVGEKYPSLAFSRSDSYLQKWGSRRGDLAALLYTTYYVKRLHKNPDFADGLHFLNRPHMQADIVLDPYLIKAPANDLFTCYINSTLIWLLSEYDVFSDLPYERMMRDSQLQMDAYENIPL